MGEHETHVRLTILGGHVFMALGLVFIFGAIPLTLILNTSGFVFGLAVACGVFMLLNGWLAVATVTSNYPSWLSNWGSIHPRLGGRK